MILVYLFLSAKECVRSYLGCFWLIADDLLKKCLFEIFVRHALPKKRKAPTDTPHIKVYIYILLAKNLGNRWEHVEICGWCDQISVLWNMQKVRNRLRNHHIYWLFSNLVNFTIWMAEIAMANLTHICFSVVESQTFWAKSGVTWALETFLAFQKFDIFSREALIYVWLFSKSTYKF